MPELVALKTQHYTLVVWSKKVNGRQLRLEKTLADRGKVPASSIILMSPTICIGDDAEPKGEYTIEGPHPVFFENKQYDIEFTFNDDLKNTFKTKPPCIEHRLKSIEDSFHYSPRTHSLRASINTGNDIGWFRIELVYQLENQSYKQSFSFEVLPTKIDLAADLQKINKSIDELFPLWRFSLAEKTQHQMKAVKQPHSQFLLLWLAQFESLWCDLNKGLKQIINAPHSRLVATQNSVTMDNLKGRLTQKLEREVHNAKKEQQWDKRFQLNKKILSVDTPENRFIKSVVMTSINKLSKITNLIQQNQLAPEKQRLSDSFINQLDQWQTSMRFFQRQPMFKEIGKFTGLSRESLVLQQKPGYARVYKIWQQLKWYLELLEGQNNLSLRSISELYEIWCFLEVRRILIELGFEETQSRHIPLVNSGIEVSLSNKIQGAFRFKRADGVTIRLAHEPQFGAKGNPVKSWITTQIPDIFLEATFPDGQVFVWIFDAKYRIKDSEKDFSSKSIDEVPDDAINQMHRYRDALIHQIKKNGINSSEKTRPIFGAYALYPGYFTQSIDTNPYSDAIEEVGIGAFSLLPSDDHQGSLWLHQFLEEKLGTKSLTYNLATSDKYFVDEAPRIPYHGTTVTRFNDLTIAASQLGNRRNQEYTESFEKGEAQFYHTKFKAFKRQNIEFHVVIEAKYLVVALDKNTGIDREIKYIYPILSARQVRRADIDNKKAGTNLISDPNELYWLFELGKSLILKTPIKQNWQAGFELKLVNRESLSEVINWDSIETRYNSLL